MKSITLLFAIFILFFSSYSYAVSMETSAIQNINKLDAANDLSQVFVYPNPANFAGGATTVNFTNLAANCSIRIFNATGNLVKTINITSGSGETSWSGQTNYGGAAESGVYFYLIESGNEKRTGKFIIIR